MTPTRRLAAIMAADIAGFSAAMERDEEGTFAQVRELRQKIIEPKIAEHQGRLIKTTGDGFLGEFASPIAATKCALAIQAELASAPLQLRIGLNLGDVIVEANGDVYGEGVNVAARLEALADPGGILISAKVHGEVEGKVEAAFEDRGEQQVKNIARPVRVYAARIATARLTGVARAAVGDGKPLPLPDKPSIAVLPFQNMSGDPEQEYFAEGVVEDIITALSRFKSLFVIARNSSFTYKGKNVDIKQVGRELGVRYVLEGSVRKAGGKVRITGQLIDATNGSHLWADRFDGSHEDVFDLQDSITTKVVGAIVPRLDQAAIEAARRKPPDSEDAYDHYLRGRMFANQRTLDSVNKAELEFRKAIDIDPNFGLAYAWAARCTHLRRFVAQRPVGPEERATATRLAERAVELAGDDDQVVALAWIVIANVDDQLERGAALADRAIALNPNSSLAWIAKGWSSVYLENIDAALEAFDRAIRLNPLDREQVRYALFGKSWICELLGRYEEGAAWADQMLAQYPNDLTALTLLEGNFFRAGRKEEAKAIADRIRETYPALRASDMRGMYSRAGNPEHVGVMDKNIDRLGLPE